MADRINTSMHPIHEPRNHLANRALLESLGVDGKVPLAQARINAGLPPIVANDNARALKRKIAA